MRLRLVFLPALALSVLAGVGIVVTEGDVSVSEIVRLEFAGSVERAEEVMAGWSPAQRFDTGVAHGLDYLYAAAYGLTFAVACVWAGRTYRGRLARFAVPLAWGMAVAAAADAVENVAMLDMIRGPVESPAPQVAAAFAGLKFALLALGALYSLGAVGVRLRSR